MGGPTKRDSLTSLRGRYEESHYYLILARDLGYAETDSLLDALDQVSRLLNAYSRAILASNS